MSVISEVCKLRITGLPSYLPLNEVNKEINKKCHDRNDHPNYYSFDVIIPFCWISLITPYLFIYHPFNTQKLHINIYKIEAIKPSQQI